MVIVFFSFKIYYFPVMNSIFTKLKFSRCREVMSDRDTALIHLESREFTAGEPVLISYYDALSARINTLMAVGIGEGIGKDFYRLITLGQFELVWGVGTELPDVSSLVHNEVYLYKDINTGIWYYVSAPDGRTRILEPILPIQHTFLSVQDNTIYTSGSDGIVRSITDFYTRSEIDALLETISGGDFTSLSNLENKLSQAYQKILEVTEENEEILATIEELQGSIDVINSFAERVDGIEKKVEKLEVIEQPGGENSVSGSFANIQLEGEGNTIVLDSTTVITTENINNFINEATEAIPEEILINNLT